MGTFKLAFGFIVIVGIAYCGFQIAPVEMANYSFEDDLKQVALVGASTPGKTFPSIHSRNAPPALLT